MQVLASVFRRGGKSKILDPAVLAEAEIHNQHNLALALPDEILIAIFSFLAINDVGNAIVVCKRYHELINDDCIWRMMLQNRFPLLCLHHPSIERKVEDKMGWKNFVKHHLSIQHRFMKGEFTKVRTLKTGDTDRVWAVEADEEKIVAGSTSRKLQIWDAKDLSLAPRVLKGHTAEIRCLKFRGNIVVSGGYDRTLRVWNANDDECVKVINPMSDVYALQMDDRRVIAAGKDGKVSMFDIETGDAVQQPIVASTDCLRALAFDGHNRIVSGGEDNVAKVWDVRNNECVATLQKHTGGVSCVQFDDRKILTGSFDMSVVCWDATNFACLSEFRSHDSNNENKYSASFYYHSPVSVWQLQYDDFKLVTAHANKRVKMWDLATAEECASIVCHTGEVITLCFTEDRLITGSEDRCMKVHEFA